MDYQYLAYKESWEQARLIAYLIAQTNSKKKLKMTDILKFQWDEDGIKKNVSDTSMSNSDLERLKMKAQQYLNENIL